MSGFRLFSAVAAILFGLGFYGLIARHDLFHKVLAVNVMGSGVFLFLVSTARRDTEGGQADPVPHALVLTGIVVAVSVTALALAFVRRLHREGAELTLHDREEEG